MRRAEVVGLHEMGRGDGDVVARVGGKAANLAVLLRMGGVRVPGGFCITADAFRRIVGPTLEAWDAEDAIDSAVLRERMEATPIPDDLAAAVADALAVTARQAEHRRDEEVAWAVRSSATTEDLVGASFAGQHDSFLDVRGTEAVLDAIRRCWASIVTDRAVAYRRRAGVDHGQVAMAVVVQELVSPVASGVLFTAHPVNGNRRDAVVEAVVGLGEALVSGRAAADSFTVRDGAITTRTTADVGPDGPALDDRRVVELVELGRRIEAALGRPQDLEWCLDADGFAIVQSRPITTCFPIPHRDDDAAHVYLSVGHQQMMTDPFRPLGWSLWQRQAMAPMHEAGGRLWVDVAPMLSMPATRAALSATIERSDPLTADALRTVVDRGDLVPASLDDTPAAPSAPATAPAPLDPDPALVATFVEQGRASIDALRRSVDGVSGPAAFDAIVDGIERLKVWLTDPAHTRVIMAGMEASWWLDDHLADWLGERGVVDTLTRSAPGNVSSAMGLALADVADVIRPHPDLVRFLEHADDTFLDDLATATVTAGPGAIAGAAEAHAAMTSFLDRYGMRCAAEIDVTRPRWSERPSALLGALLADVRHLEPGEAARRFERGAAEAEAEERRVLALLRSLPDGEARATEAEGMIRRVRTFIGYREFPKFVIVGQLALHRRVLWREADALVDEGVLAHPDDLAHLTFDEARRAVEERQVDGDLIERRRDEHRRNESLSPPRVLTSDGESVEGRYRRDDEVPEGALVGLGVSTGIVEGIARVVDDHRTATVGAGEILVTAHTDPSWSPLFVAAVGLVTEVGGLMTHGAVVAREYGLPAIVGVVDATRLIRDGQRLRLDGTTGIVERLD
jgi:phosphoenolpyruvate synthase/pyruvate phosphate dikinase